MSSDRGVCRIVRHNIMITVGADGTGQDEPDSHAENCAQIKRQYWIHNFLPLDFAIFEIKAELGIVGWESFRIRFC